MSLPLEVRPASGRAFAAMIVSARVEALEALTRDALAPGERVLLRLRVRPGAPDEWLRASVLVSRPCDAGIWTRVTMFELADADPEVVEEIKDAIHPPSRPHRPPPQRRLFAGWLERDWTGARHSMP